MPTSRHTQTSFASGEFDPLLWSREDVTFFYNSARILENVIPLPQGGAARREGWAFKAVQRGALSAVTVSGKTVTATNGGTAANGIDADEATKVTTATGISTTAEYEIFRIDMGSATRVSLADFTDLRFISLPAGVTSGTVTLQHSSDGSSWTDADSIGVGNTAYDRRFGVAPDSDLGTARYWRIIVDNPGGATDFSTATIEFSELYFWAEAGYSQSSVSPGNFALHRLTSSISDEYAIVMTAGNCDVFRFDTGAWVAAVSVPHTDAQVADVNSSPKLDTMIFYHEDVATWQIQRLGSDGDWRTEAVTFDSVVEFPFEDDDVSGGLNAIQHISFTGMTAGEEFTFEYNGVVSSAAAWSTTAATCASNIETAIETLDDITSVTVTVDADHSSGDKHFLIEFDGVDGKKAWPILVCDLLDSHTGVVELGHRQYGRPDFDSLWSATRGYASCGAFYQGRHYMGGFKARPDIIIASRAGALFDFKEDADPVVASPIVVAPNLDDQVTIRNIYPGRHLQIFTSSAELYVPSEPVTIDNIALKVTSRHGASGDVQPVDIQGGTLFIDRNGRSLREYLFTDTEQSYSAEPVSLLAGHLVASPRSLALRRARDVDEPTLLLLANTGTDRAGNSVPASAVVIDRAQQVTAFCRIKTVGTPLGFETSQAGDGLAMVSRELAGNAWNFLEKFDADFMSDSAVEISNADYDHFTATASQTVFTYTFTSPATASDVAVWTRASSSDDWGRISSADYTVDLGAKTVTFGAGLSAGTLVRVNLRQGTATVTGSADHLEGISCECHADGITLGALTPSSGVVDLGDDRFDFTFQLGLRQVPRIVLHPYKGRGDLSPTMQRQRIFRVLLQLERTGAIAITAHDGGTPRAVSIQNYDSGVMDPVLEEVLFSGAKRVSGLGKWQIEPTIEITQISPMPFLLRSATFDIRY